MSSRGTASLPSLWTHTIKYFSVRGVKIHVDHMHCTIYTVASTNYIDPYNNSTNNELTKNIVSEAFQLKYRGQQTFSNVIIERNTAQNNAMRLENVKDMFSDNLCQCWEDFKTNAISL